MHSDLNLLSCLKIMHILIEDIMFQSLVVYLYFLIDPQMKAIKVRLSIVNVELQGIPKIYQ